MHKDNLKSFGLLACGLVAGSLIAIAITCDRPSEPVAYIGHHCNYMGQSFYSDDLKLLKGRCMWVHPA